MGKKRHGKPFQSKWKPALNTFDIAASKVSRINPELVNSLANSLKRSVDDLLVPNRSAVAFQDLRVACVVSIRVERLGVVKGLGVIMDEAFVALESMREQCMVSGVWRFCMPSEKQLQAIREMAKFHSFQLSHLSTGEFEKVYLAARSEMATLPKVLLSPESELKAA